MASSSRKARLQKDFAVGNGGSSSEGLVDTKLFFQQAKLAREISMKPAVNNSTKNQIKALETEQDMVPKGSGKSKEIVELNQRRGFPFVHPRRSRNQRTTIGNDQCSVGKSCDVGKLVGLAGTQQSAVGILSSVPIHDDKEKRKASTHNQDNVEYMCRGKGKEIELSSDSQPKGKESLARQMQLDGLLRNVWQNRVVRNGCIFPSHMENSSIPSRGCPEKGTDSLTAEVSDEDNQRGKNLCREPQQLRAKEKILEPLICEDSSRKAGQRKLVRNGCISPSNVALYKNVVEEGKNKVGMMSNNHEGEISSLRIQNVNHDLEGTLVNKSKGKVIVDGSGGNNGQEVKAITLPKRLRLSRGKEVTNIHGDSASHKLLVQTTTCNSVADANFRSTTQTGTSSATVDRTFDSTQDISFADRDFMSYGDISMEVSDLNPRSNSVLSPESEPKCRKQNLMKRKRKLSSSSSQFGECSSSAFDGPEIENHGSNTGPIIEVEELSSPEGPYASSEERGYRASDCSARTRQVESDEILAYQLQEQFYNETPTTIHGEEIGATISWSLQQQDSRRRASASVRRDRTYPSVRSSISRRDSARRSANRAQTFPSFQMAHFRINRRILDLEQRLDVLEALEAAYDDGNLMEFSRDALHVQRDFNENDYEMLLALDNNNNHVGASQSQINSLPHSTVQTENYEETCAVCLEVPSLGDFIRHLPCLHKFHKECIDTWLRRKRSCPICKSCIT